MRLDRAVLLALLVLGTCRGLRAEPFLREDWVYSIEPTHLDYWGINHWGVTNFDLPYRVLQRGKHQLETSYAGNWTFGSETGGKGGTYAETGLGLRF